MSALTFDTDLQRCIQDCEACHDVCLAMATGRCLELGGRHSEPQHLRLMLNCAQICRTAADFMVTQSHLHRLVCGVCAAVCEACANSCDEVGEMEACSRTCRACADSCRTMAREGEVAVG